MNKRFRLAVASISLALGAAFAAPAAIAAPKAGADYQILPTPQPVSAQAGKIEVIEFFWYGCPHCAELEPKLEAWVRKQGADVQFHRIPVAFRDDFVPHSKMYHALDAMGLAEQLAPKIFTAIHVQKNYLLTPEAQADFLAQNGVDRVKYLAAYNSFSTTSAVNRDKQLLNDFHIDGVPTIEVQGKYETGPAMTNSIDGALQALDYLVEQVRAKKM
jgi:thiol:disulfide interchange protein DsbA